MKLVLTYNTGEFDGCDITIPFEYESVEAAYQTLHSEFLRWKKECDAYYKHSHAIPNANASEKSWAKWNSSRPQYPDSSIKLGTIPELTASHFSLNGEYLKPSIQTLDEWFMSNKQ